MSRRQRKNLTRIIIALIVFAASFVAKINIVRHILMISSYLVVGYDVLLSAGRKIFSGQIFDEEFLMSLATVGAILLREYPEATMVMLLYQTGELFQGIAVGKSRKSIKELMKIKPDSARVIYDGKEKIVSPEEVVPGEIILVLPGDKVPLDGIIVKGRTSFDSSSLTGESLPLEASEGEKAVSGMINLESPVEIRVSGTYEESTVAKILNLVETSSAYKSRSEKFITKFSRKYTPCVFISALLTILVPTIIFGQPLVPWLRRALVFLVVSCPCALVISVPLTFFGGIGAASRQGILIKGSNYLETLSEIEKIAFDKTGTITCGGFLVEEVSAKGISRELFLETLALAESFSNHPIALSIVRAYGKEPDKSRVENVVNLPGNGVRADVDGKTVIAGNKGLMKSNGIEVEDLSEGQTVVHLAVDGKYVGFISLADKIKPEAENVIRELKKLGVKRTIMLTGDNFVVAKKVSELVGTDEVYSSLLPHDKVSLALKIKEEGKGKLAFVGDGINDAPVLSCVDIGIAMGALGSDAAIEAADVVVMNDSLSAVSKSMGIAKKTMRIVRQNIFIALFIKFGVMILSIAGFDNMYAAIFADVGVMVIAVLNAMRMLRK